ncbi:MAG TPA: hotdog fold thioesterase [Anaerolineae bacterium]|nr:hotdog fold thioesterase [Anaerolineae bacterium]
MDVETKRKILEKMRSDRYTELLGMELLDVEPGYSRVSMVIRDDMFNFNDLPHGGAIFSLADVAFSAASNSHGIVSVALNMEISYLRSVPSGTKLVAEATEEHLGRRTALYHITVKSEVGDLIASCHGVVYRKKERFLDD